MHLDLTTFLVPYTEEEGRLDGFLLDATLPPLGLALDRHSGRGGEQPCVFLMRLGDGNDRCGIYDHRPDVCRAYPMSMWNRVVFQRRDPLCPPNSWPAAELARPSWREAITAQHFHFDIYCEVVACWNAQVTASAAPFQLEDYYSYLMNTYDRLAALDADLGEETLVRVQATWPALPRESLQSDPEAMRGEFVWLDYLLRARETIGGLFPGVAPRPLLALDPEQWPAAFSALSTS
jgi:Fe-S-cluster containining protein